MSKTTSESFSNQVTFQVNITVDELISQLAPRLAERLLPAKRLLTIREAATYIGRTESAMRHLIAAGTIPKVQSDGRIFVDIEDLNRWIELSK